MKTTALPRVTANFAITADGKVATRCGGPSSFTSPADKRRMLEIRAEADAVLAGAATVLADSMTLRVNNSALQALRRSRELPPEPLRVVVSNSGKLDPAHRLFHCKGAPLLVYTTQRMPRPVREALAHTSLLRLFPRGTVPLRSMLADLRNTHEVRRVVCEGGPRLFRALLEQGLVYDLCITLSARLFGGAAAPSITGLPGPFLPHSLRARLVGMEVVDSECFLRYRLT